MCKVSLLVELLHFGVIAHFFRQIGGHSSRLMLEVALSEDSLATRRMIKGVKLLVPLGPRPTDGPTERRCRPIS